MGKRNYKKRAPRIKMTTSVDDFDLKDVEPLVIAELQTGILPNSTDYSEGSYDIYYKKYITEVFSSKCVHFIVHFLRNSKDSFLKNSKDPRENLANEKQIYKNFLSIVKELMMNEIEVLIFIKYFKNIEFNVIGIHHLVHIFFIAIFSKAKCNRNIDIFLNRFKSQNKYFEKCYQQWKKIQEEQNNDFDINSDFNLSDINRVFISMNKRYNKMCQKDYIDYNCIVDTITTLSQPYREQDNPEASHEDKIIDLIKSDNQPRPRCGYMLNEPYNNYNGIINEQSEINNQNQKLSNFELQKNMAFFENSSIIQNYNSYGHYNSYGNTQGLYSVCSGELSFPFPQSGNQMFNGIAEVSEKRNNY